VYLKTTQKNRPPVLFKEPSPCLVSFVFNNVAVGIIILEANIMVF